MPIMRNQVDRTVSQIVHSLSPDSRPHVLALGGDIRFACARLLPDWGEHKETAKLRVPELTKLSRRILEMSVDRVVKRYHVSYPDAETLGPALLIYARLARALKLKELLVGRASLREGVLAEMATDQAWTEEFKQQVINSALEIGAKYEFDRQHAEQVARLARKLFAALLEEHRLGPSYELILTVAALLHEIGSFISNRAHHKHSLYLIQNSDIFGLGATDLVLTALVARYHRRAMPKPSHDLYATLERHERVAVAKLAAILRVADALTRGRRDCGDIRIDVRPGTVTITVEGTGNLALQRHGLRQKGDMFRRTYGMNLVLRSTRRRTPRAKP
jgi:exopolyphosphatase/guanosine-5'-triphosphate,3'-diphosphate pyrophosphatase